MAQTANQSVLRQLLTNFSRSFKAPELAWYNIFPRMKVDEPVGQFEVADFTEARVVQDGFADGDSTRRVDFGWRYEPYQVENHGLHKPFTRQQRENDRRFEARRLRVAKGIIQLVQNNTERRVISTMTASANNIATASTLDLSNLASSALYPALSVAMNTIRAACGAFPNTVAMNPSTLMRISQLAEYRDNVKYVMDLSQAGLPRQLMNGELEVVTFHAALDTAKKGVASSISYIFGNHIWVGYVEKAGLGEQTMTYGATLYTDEYSREFYDDTTETTSLEYKFLHVPKVVTRECGYLIPVTL